MYIVVARYVHLGFLQPTGHHLGKHRQSKVAFTVLEGSWNNLIDHSVCG